MFDTIDFTQYDEVVAAVDCVGAGTFHCDQASGKYRATAFPGLIRPVLELMFLWAGKIFGQSLLVFTKNIDAKSIAFAKGVQASGGIGQTNKYQRRVKGNRRKGINGYSNGYAIVGQARDNSNASGKKPKGFAEFERIDWHSRVIFLLKGATTEQNRSKHSRPKY